MLDPLGTAQVPDRLRAHFNLLAALDPNDGELVAKVDRIANAICRIPDSGEAAEWARKGKAYVASVILHVVTAEPKHIEAQGLRRDILTVRDLVTEGHYRRAAALNADAKAKPGEAPKRYDPYKLLLLQMEHNPACHSAIARYARDMLQSSTRHVRYFESVRSSAVEHLRFLEDQGIVNTVSAATAGAAWPRTFRVEDVKDQSVSIFLCLPEHSYDPLDRWLRAMIEILLGGLQERQGLGKNGQRVLFCIDEFANLGRMDSIAKASNSIAGAGVKCSIPVAPENASEITVTMAPPEMVVIPAGSFIMGSPESENWRTNNEGPQHQVTFSRPFAIGRYAVTFDEYDVFCATAGREKPKDEKGSGRGRRPVINVSWDDAVHYCWWLSAQTGQTYRLPSEAEWEYACRAGTMTPFHFGETISPYHANYNSEYDYGGGPTSPSRNQTVPVGSLPANPWGLYETHGNVDEWTEYCWNESDVGVEIDGSLSRTSMPVRGSF